MGIMVVPIFTSHAADIPDMDEMAKKFKEKADSGETLEIKDMIDFTSMSSAQTCNERIRDIFIDMHNLGYI